MSNERLLGTAVQGVDEIKSYADDTTALGGSPTAVSVVCKEYSAAGYAVVTSTVMPSGSVTVVGNVIHFPPLKLLTAGVTYRIEVLFTIGGNTYEDYMYVVAEL